MAGGFHRYGVVSRGTAGGGGTCQPARDRGGVKCRMYRVEAPLYTVDTWVLWGGGTSDEGVRARDGAGPDLKLLKGVDPAVLTAIGLTGP